VKRSFEDGDEGGEVGKTFIDTAVYRVNDAGTAWLVTAGPDDRAQCRLVGRIARRWTVACHQLLVGQTPRPANRHKT
jgi:hypothetical protein